MSIKDTQARDDDNLPNGFRCDFTELPPQLQTGLPSRPTIDDIYIHLG